MIPICREHARLTENVSAGVLFSKSFVRLGSSHSPCKFLHLFRFVVFLPSSCSVVVSYFLQTILIRLARVLCWQLVNTANAPLHSLRSNLYVSTRELTHPALSTNCKSDHPLWLVKRKWHLWQLSSAEPAWKWDSQRSWPEAFFSLGLGASFSASRRKFPNKKDSIKESLWDQGTSAVFIAQRLVGPSKQLKQIIQIEHKLADDLNSGLPFWLSNFSGVLRFLLGYYTHDVSL